MTVLAEYLDYLRRSPKHYASGTIQAKTREAFRWMDWIDDPWAATVADVEAWAGDLELSASSTRDAVSHVRGFYRWAIRTGRTVTDPTATVDLPRAVRRLPRPARDVAISVAVQAATPEMRAMLALMSGAGLRCCEVAWLRWSDVDMIAGTVHVVGKFQRERVLEISPDVRRALAAIDHPGAHVFERPAGGQYTPCRVSQIVNAHLRLCSAGCTAHQLRHRYATRALADSRDITVVRDLLGHSTVAVTEIYAKVTPGAAGRISKSIPVPGLS